MEQITKLLQQLAIQLGTTVEYLWGALIKQQYVSAYTEIIWAVIFVLVEIVFAKRMWSWIQTFSDEKEYLDLGSRRKKGICAYAVIQLILVIIIATNITSGIMTLVNPEYYALKEILTGLK